MSVRDDPVLFLQQGKGKTIGGGTAGGGSAITTTHVHRLNGPEHTLATDDDRLNASTSQHGLMPKLTGDPADVWTGTGWGSATGGGFVPTYIGPAETFRVPADRQALYAAPIDNEGILDVVGLLIEVD
jgi:hypothetical protein